MKTVRYSTQFKKDFKKYRNNKSKVQKLMTILRFLVIDEIIPSEYRPHKLLGQYNNCMECHIEGDFLLIWFDKDTDEITLVRLGSHSELF